MNAAEARALTQKNLKGPVIAPLLEICKKAIACAATDGKSSIHWPLDGLRMPITNDQHRAVRQQLAAEGYIVTDHPDPDPGHPCSRSYTTLSW